MSVKLLIFIFFFVWGLPLAQLRSKFRKMAYKTDDWKINIYPYFWRELKVLFGIEKLQTDAEKKIRLMYQVYLFVYFGLLFLVIQGS